jgi:hypothetical protein
MILIRLGEFDTYSAIWFGFGMRFTCNDLNGTGRGDRGVM